MDLSKFIAEHKQDDLTVWRAFNGAKIEIAFADKAEVRAMLEASREQGFGRRRRVMGEGVDSKKFNARLARKVKGWQGVTLGWVAANTNIDLGGEDPEKEVPCEPKNVEALLNDVYDFDNFLLDVVMSISEYRDAREGAELKN